MMQERHEDFIGQGLTLWFEIGLTLLALHTVQSTRSTDALPTTMEHWERARDHAERLRHTAEVAKTIEIKAGGQLFPLRSSPLEKPREGKQERGETLETRPNALNSPLTQFPDLLTVNDVCHILRVTRRTVYTLITSQQLTAVRIGKGYKISKWKFQEYLDRHQ